MSPRPTFEAPQYYHQSPLRSQLALSPQTAAPSTCQLGPPLSPTVGVAAQRAARHRAPRLSNASMCTSYSGEQAQVSFSGLTSSSVSERDESSSSEVSSDVLPSFTSDARDLVEIGSLQLVSMGSQHRGAFEAARLLRSLKDIGDPTRPSLDMSTLAESLPFSLDGFQLSDLYLSVLFTGLGLQQSSGPCETPSTSQDPGLPPGAPLWSTMSPPS